jgi:YgiT-type zinc finger domain-containing protein
MMDADKEQSPPQFHNLCSECQTGVMRLRYLTYFTWLNEELITVPNFPAWVCDVCGRREFDSRAITRLNTLLNHEAGSRTRSRWKTGKPRKNRPVSGSRLDKA